MEDKNKVKEELLEKIKFGIPDIVVTDPKGNKLYTIVGKVTELINEAFERI